MELLEYHKKSEEILHLLDKIYHEDDTIHKDAVDIYEGLRDLIRTLVATTSHLRDNPTDEEIEGYRKYLTINKYLGLEIIKMSDEKLWKIVEAIRCKDIEQSS